MTDHIKIPDIVPIVRYVADGVQTEFTYPFPVFASEDLKISFDGAPQYTGYDIANVGQSTGGVVTFDTAPTQNVIVTLSRVLPLERMTDFIEGGDFSARAINNELDYLTASIQQVDRMHQSMLHYDDTEEPSDTVLPVRAMRAGKALGFDGKGDPVAISLEGSMAAPDFTVAGTGAVTRTSHDKFSDIVSVKDFGALGDGLSDDTLAIQKALSVYDAVFVPEGTYLVSATITLSERQSLLGSGQRSVLKAINNSFNVIEIVADYVSVQNLRIEGGNTGIKLYGRDRPCVQNCVQDVSIFAAHVGVELDGYEDGNYPCYWNNFSRVLVAQPATHGVYLHRSGAGDTPNANRFHMCRVYSLGADITGSGFYVEEGSFNNSFIDCEANVKGTAQSCFRLGAGSNKTLLINPYAESNNMVPNVRLDEGSQETAIYNLLSASDGAAIYDLSGGNYDAFNAGWPDKNTLRRTGVSDLRATLMRYDTEYIDTTGLVEVDISHSMHLVSSYGGDVEMRLPHSADAVGVMITIKKVDSSGHLVTVTEDGGAGPDGKSQMLGGQYDYVSMLSDGAKWFIIASNRMAGNTRYFDGTGTYDIDMAVDVYLLSSYGGALTARLPPADATEAVGRSITLKKTDTSSNVITITEQGGTGPDNYAQPLSSQYEAMTVVSNGSQWYITSKF